MAILQGQDTDMKMRLKRTSVFNSSHAFKSKYVTAKPLKWLFEKRWALPYVWPTLSWLSKRQDGKRRSVRLEYLLLVSILFEISGTPGPNDMLCCWSLYLTPLTVKWLPDGVRSDWRHEQDGTPSTCFIFNNKYRHFMCYGKNLHSEEKYWLLTIILHGGK